MHAGSLMKTPKRNPPPIGAHSLLSDPTNKEIQPAKPPMGGGRDPINFFSTQIRFTQLKSETNELLRVTYVQLRRENLFRLRKKNAIYWGSWSSNLTNWALLELVERSNKEREREMA